MLGTIGQQQDDLDARLSHRQRPVCILIFNTVFHTGWSYVTLQTYVLKMARSGEEGEKVFLLLESGSRFHTTKVGRRVAFCMVPADAARLREPMHTHWYGTTACTCCFGRAAAPPTLHPQDDGAHGSLVSGARLHGHEHMGYTGLRGQPMVRSPCTHIG